MMDRMVWLLCPICGNKTRLKVRQDTELINTFPALTLAAQLVRVEKFIYGNIQKGDELVKGVEAGVLAPIFNIHDGAGGEVYKLGQMLLRPAFGLASALDFFAQGATVQAFFILVHSHITPILFYISGWNMRTKRYFIF